MLVDIIVMVIIYQGHYFIFFINGKTKNKMFVDMYPLPILKW